MNYCVPLNPKYVQDRMGKTCKIPYVTYQSYGCPTGCISDGSNALGLGPHNHQGHLSDTPPSRSYSWSILWHGVLISYSSFPTKVP